MTEAVNSTASGIYRKGWAALAVKAAAKASGVRESRIAMHETQTRVVDELTNSDGRTFANEQSLRLIVDTIPGHVCTLSAAGQVQLLNRQLLEYFGKTTGELKNWATSDAVHPDDLPRVIDAWRRSVETGQPFEDEHRERRADGVYRWFQSRALPVRDSEGRITGWYMLLTDIDDPKRAEDDLRSNEPNPPPIVHSIPAC